MRMSFTSRRDSRFHSPHNPCQWTRFVRIIVAVSLTVIGADDHGTMADPSTSTTRTTVPVSEECSIVMAPSTIPKSGWGIFSLKDRTRGDLVSPHGDIVLHLTDPNPLTAVGMKRVIWEYLWEGQEVGGQYEGQRVMSAVPGIGMLSNGEVRLFNVVPMTSMMDNAGVTRTTSPASGSFTHYHNLTWRVEKDMDPGSEIFVNYGEGWFRERGYDLQETPTGRRPVEWLRQHGYCLDSIVPGKSKIKHAGRGVFAGRFLDEGEIVAPVPLLTVTADSLETIKEHESGRIVVMDQLLRNYCFGHANSSILLYPYGGSVNLINHGTTKEANVKFQWSDLSAASLQLPISQLKETSPQLFMELVAMHPIEEGEEILLDYGRDWEDAWDRHVRRWRSEGVINVVSSQMANQDPSNQILRTAAEQQVHPYPDNIFTSCFYHFNVDEQRGAEINVWRSSPGLMTNSRNLRPCMVMNRHVANDGELLYTVRMFNRPGLTPSASLPKGKPHIVTGVPRSSIEFSDKLYTTDQHLESAFRKEIGLSIFPRQWMDLDDVNTNLKLP